MKTTFISMFPILIATLSLFFKKSTCYSMSIGIITGLAIFLLKNGLSIKYIILISNIIINTVIDNTTVLLNILFLFTFVYLIQNSKIILALNDFMEIYMFSSKRIIIFLIIFGIIFSLDDYLACIAMGTIFTTTATKQGFSKEKIAFMINITAVSCCCISPFSSWMPVLKSTLSNSGLEETMIYDILPYNYSALLGIIIVIFIGLFKPNAFNSISEVKNKTKNPIKHFQKQTMNNHSGIFAFFFIISIFIGSLLLMTFIFTCSYAIIKSTIISLSVAIPMLIYTNAIDYLQIKQSLVTAIKSTWDLSKLLISIWLLTNICNNILGLSDAITSYTNNAQFPIILLPSAIFALSGIFAFFTGSAYGTFGLFIPLATKLTINVSLNIQTITIAAAIAGSLMAASSFASDTLQLTIKNTQSNKKYLQFAQLPYSLLIYTLGILNFLISSYCIQYGKTLSIIIPIILSICTSMGLLALESLLYTQVEKIASHIVISYILATIYHYKFQTYPEPQINHTLHSKYYKKQLYLLQNKIISFKKDSFPLKLPG